MLWCRRFRSCQVPSISAAFAFLWLSYYHTRSRSKNRFICHSCNECAGICFGAWTYWQLTWGNVKKHAGKQNTGPQELIFSTRRQFRMLSRKYHAVTLCNNASCHPRIATLQMWQFKKVFLKCFLNNLVDLQPQPWHNPCYFSRVRQCSEVVLGWIDGRAPLRLDPAD